MTPKTKIQKITELFGMKANVAAKAIGISVHTYNKCNSNKAITNKFNDQHVENLKKYVNDTAKKVQERF